MDVSLVRTLVGDTVSDELVAEAGRRSTADERAFAVEILDYEIAREENRLAEIDERLSELTS